MFKRYPYWGWLLLGLCLWGITGYRFYTHYRALQPERVAHVIEDDLHRRERSLNAFTQEQELIKHIFSGALKEDEQEKLFHLPFYVFAYSSDSLVYWNTNTVQLGCNPESTKLKLIRTTRGVFLQECIGPPFINSWQKLVVLLPVTIRYPMENDYLRSRFLAADNIPTDTFTTRILDKKTTGGEAVKTLDGKPAFYIRSLSQSVHRWIPDDLFLGLLIASILASISWLQLMVITLAKRSPLLGFIATAAIASAISFLTYKYRDNLPFGIDNLPIFSPRLYASSTFLSSLGALLINTICVLWVVVFITRHTPYKTFFKDLRSRSLKTALGIALIVLLIIYSFTFVNIIRSLVIDSNIPFDVSHFYAISTYTILGIFTIGAITGVSCLVIYLFSIQLAVLINNKLLKYLLILIIGLMFIWTRKDVNVNFALFLLAWLILYIGLLDVRRLKMVTDLLTPHMIFWAVFICTFSTAILQYFNDIKERDTRKIFASQRLAPERDEFMEYTFSKISDNILEDKAVKNFFLKPNPAERKALNEQFSISYLRGPLNKYDPKIYLFDAKGHNLFNKDTASYGTLLKQIRESDSTVANTLYYKEQSANEHRYTAYIPIKNDSFGSAIGYIFIDLALKQTVNETVYPELLQPSVAKASLSENDYSYAVYINGQLVSQTNDYPFPVHLKDTLHTKEFTFYNRNTASELLYKYNDKKTLIVAHNRNLLLETTTLFSYIFGVEISIALLILIYQLYLSYFTNTTSVGKFIRLSLRRRIHYSMLAVVLVSFIIIGVVTIFFFKNEYNGSNIKKLQSAIEFVERSMKQYVKQENVFLGQNKTDTTNRKFKYFVTNLAYSRQIDINVYNSSGSLMVTSQDDIYDKGLLARIIRYDAFYRLTKMGRSIVIQDEKIGDLSYLSCYVPLRDDKGKALGYINIPFFSSEKELNFQISNIVVTLINLYAFIFLISGLFTIFVTRWLTRTLNIIISQFSRLNLQQNERIVWPYDDEIGLLVKEYNKMVKKVEENATLLAQSERETAWREMARQVAHEIKNPLTPMKLNIQYLQQAMKNGHTNVKELVERVSGSLIEQIDNLSYIASEFSNFAKMPEARPEELEIGELLGRCVELHLSSEDLYVSLNTYTEKLFVYADRSQLLRVFNNLIENAKQAIPEGRKGNIEVLIKKEDSKVIVSVSDNGIGMNEEVVSRIFQPYFTTKSSGTGLGLAMTKKIIEFWKGEIWFETHEGKGTVFFIRLPLIKKERQ